MIKPQARLLSYTLIKNKKSACPGEQADVAGLGNSIATAIANVLGLSTTEDIGKAQGGRIRVKVSRTLKAM